MATLPLLAKGRALGAIEATSRSPGYFDERRIRLARTLAAEAGMALENSRLYEELRHQAFHDSLTGLANRALFQDRVEHALARARGRRSGGWPCCSSTSTTSRRSTTASATPAATSC